MKKFQSLLIICVISFFYSVNSFSQWSLNMCEYSVTEAKKQKIKSVKVFIEEKNESKLYYIFNYDYINNEIEKLDGYFLIPRSKIKYDSKGNHLSGIFLFGDLINAIDSSVYIYDDDSLLVKYYYYDRDEEDIKANLPSKLIYTEAYEYNGDKKIVKKTRWDNDVTIELTTLYIYDNSGIMTGGEIYDGNNNLYQLLFCDAKGNVIKTEIQDPGIYGLSVKYYEFKYNSKNQQDYSAGYDISNNLIFKNEDHLNMTGLVGETINTQRETNGELIITRISYEYEFEE